MLLERMGDTVTLEHPDGKTEDVRHVLWYDADASDQTVMDVQTRFINQARYKGDSRTLTLLWPKGAPHDLMDCHVWVGEERFRVYADPRPPSNTPMANGYDVFVTATHSLYLYDAELLRATRTRDEWGAWHTDAYVATPTKANLLRLSEDMTFEVGQHGMGGTVLLELPPDTWDEIYCKFRFQGHVYTIKSMDRANETVVIGGTMESTDYQAEITVATTTGAVPTTTTTGEQATTTTGDVATTTSATTTTTGGGDG